MASMHYYYSQQNAEASIMGIGMEISLPRKPWTATPDPLLPSLALLARSIYPGYQMEPVEILNG